MEKKLTFFWSCPGVEPGPGPYTLCEKGNFSLYVGKKNLGNLSLYMAVGTAHIVHGSLLLILGSRSLKLKRTPLASKVTVKEKINHRCIDLP